MWSDTIRVAVVGFAVVFAGLWIFAISVRVMSFFARGWERKKIPKLRQRLNRPNDKNLPKSNLEAGASCKGLNSSKESSSRQVFST